MDHIHLGVAKCFACWLSIASYGLVNYVADFITFLLSNLEVNSILYFVVICRGDVFFNVLKYFCTYMTEWRSEKCNG